MLSLLIDLGVGIWLARKVHRIWLGLLIAVPCGIATTIASVSASALLSSLLGVTPSGHELAARMIVGWFLNPLLTICCVLGARFVMSRRSSN